jgi:C4-dicarboxylate-specific signal transduction histidine kinase
MPASRPAAQLLHGGASGLGRCVLLAALFAAAAPLAAQPALEPTRILTIFGHDATAPGVKAFAEPIRELVRARMGAVEFYEEYLDLDRFDASERTGRVAGFIAEKYAGFEFDAIVAEGSQALQFTLDHVRALFPGVPIVYGLAFEPVVDFDALPPDVTGRRQPLPFRETIELARALQPDAERVVLVGGAAPMDSVLLSTAVRMITPELNGLDLSVPQDWSYRSLLDSLRALPSRTIVLLSSFRRDHTGYEFATADLVPAVTRASSAPVYGIARNWVGAGVVGGGVMDFGDDGVRTGELLLRVLRRGPGAPLPTRQVAATSLVVDVRQLQRWGLPEERLPSGTTVLFQNPSAWQRYWVLILGVLVVLGAQSALIGSLLVERRRRARAQQLVEEQAEYERMLAALTNDTIRLTPEEAPYALEHALARVALYSGASAALLIAEPDAPGRAPTVLTWPSSPNPPRQAAAASTAPRELGEAHLALPLVAEDARQGVLELYRARGESWPAEIVARLDAAVSLLAGALARARAVRALRESRGQVAHMARVTTVGELAAAVTHDVRQPLAAIRFNAEAGARLLGDQPPRVAEARAVFADIMRADEMAFAVIDHIKGLLRKQESTRASVDLNVLSRQTAGLLEHDFQERAVQLRLALDPELPAIGGDPVQLQQVVLNLALNALEAVSATGRAGEVLIATSARPGQVEVFVRDSGPGLLPEHQRQIFDPFFSTKANGLGMGLAIVRTIVEQHRGTVRAENATDGGAVFRVTLPTHAAPAVTHARSTHAAAEPARVRSTGPDPVAPAALSRVEGHDGRRVRRGEEVLPPHRSGAGQATER